MPQTAFQLPIRSNPETDFLEGLAANEASATVNLRLPSKDPCWFIRAIGIVAKENKQWELQVYSKAENLGATFDTDCFIAVWQFYTLVVGPPASPGWPVDAPDVSPDNGFYHYYIDGNWQPYYDLDQLAQRNPDYNVPSGVGISNANIHNASIHCRLINRSAVAKTAGADGALQVTFYVANQGQQV